MDGTLDLVKDLIDVVAVLQNDITTKEKLQKDFNNKITSSIASTDKKITDAYQSINAQSNDINMTLEEILIQLTSTISTLKSKIDSQENSIEEISEQLNKIISSQNNFNLINQPVSTMQNDIVEHNMPST